MEWRLVKNNCFYHDAAEKTFQELPVGIYMMRWDSNRQCMYLEHNSDNFAMPERLYDFDTAFINRARRKWENADHNVGILLSGLKGTGKTITAKGIVNACKIPTIVIDSNLGYNLLTFFSTIHQEICIFVDEFEKVFPKDQTNFLALMDGVIKTKRLFLLTVNTNALNDNFFNRPGRIVYLKTYGNLSETQVDMILKDRLQREDKYQATKAYLMSLSMITVDICCKVVDEVNLFDEEPDKWKHIFNCTQENVEPPPMLVEPPPLYYDHDDEYE